MRHNHGDNNIDEIKGSNGPLSGQSRAGDKHLSNAFTTWGQFIIHDILQECSSIYRELIIF